MNSFDFTERKFKGPLQPVVRRVDDSFATINDVDGVSMPRAWRDVFFAKMNQRIVQYHKTTLGYN